MNACDFKPGVKFHIDGNGEVIYTYESILKDFMGLHPHQKHCVIRTNYDDQCNAVLLRDHLLMYKFVGLVQLQTRIQFEQLTIYVPHVNACSTCGKTEGGFCSNSFHKSKS